MLNNLFYRLFHNQAEVGRPRCRAGRAGEELFTGNMKIDLLLAQTQTLSILTKAQDRKPQNVFVKIDGGLHVPDSEHQMIESRWFHEV